MCESLARRKDRWLERTPLQKPSPRFHLDLLSRIRKAVHQLVALSKYTPSKRPEICMMIDDLTRMALEVEELREKEKNK